RVRNAPAWDILEIKLKACSEELENWVPDLAAVLERYREDSVATQTTIMGLLEMGLLQMVPNPDRPGEILLDSRPLKTLLTRYGPRVTTSTGRLGVSATKPGIWTPGSTTGGPAVGLWTPGASSSSTSPTHGD